jgi:DNA-binding XRE family transcriptional regulator
MKLEQENFYRAVGILIRDARKATGLKQEALASYLNLSRASMVNIEKGRQHPSIFLLSMIAKVLHTQVSSLIPEVSTPDIKSTATWEKIISQKIQGDKATEEKILGFLNELNVNK